jgi:hypothetical protein
MCMDAEGTDARETAPHEHMISTRRLRLTNRTGAFPSQSLHRPQRRRAERRISASDGGGHPRLVKAHVEHDSRGVPRRPDLHSTTAHPSHPGHSTRTCSTKSKRYTGHRVPFESSLRVDISRPPNVPVFSCEGQRERGARAAAFDCCNTLLGSPRRADLRSDGTEAGLVLLRP